MLRDPFVSPANERADGSWRRVEDVDPILFNDFPKTIRLRPVRCAFVHDNSRAIRQRAIDDVAVPSYPADVGGAPIDIFITNIEHVLCGRINADQITTGGM